MNEYLARDNGGYLCTISLHALLDASRRNQDGVRLNRSAREESVKRAGQSRGLDNVLYINLFTYILYDTLKSLHKKVEITKEMQVSPADVNTLFSYCSYRYCQL